MCRRAPQDYYITLLAPLVRSWVDWGKQSDLVGVICSSLLEGHLVHSVTSPQSEIAPWAEHKTHSVHIWSTAGDSVRAEQVVQWVSQRPNPLDPTLNPPDPTLIPPQER